MGSSGRVRRDRRPRRRSRAPCGPARPSSSGSRRPPIPSGPSRTSRARPRSPTGPEPGSRSTSTAASPVHTRPLALGRRPRDARGDQDPERPLGRGRRGARRAGAGRALEPHRRGAQERRRHPRALRGLSPHPRHAHPASARRRPGPRRRRSSRSVWAATRTSPTCSIPACRSTPATTSPRARWRAASAPCCRSGSRAASGRRWRRRPAWPCGSAPPRSAASRASSSTAPPIEGPGTPCPPDLLRLSTGIEDPDDLFRDLDAALRAAHR